MNISERAIIEGLKDATEAKVLVREIKDDLFNEFKGIRNSIQQDLQRLLAGEIKLAIKEGLEEHYDKVARPHIKEVSANVEKNKERITVLESDKKAIKWVVLAISGMASTVYSLIQRFL